jgi:hypothetical protein
MKPLSFPCGCEFTFYEFLGNGDELWESELCSFHRDLMDGYLAEEERAK